MKLSNFFIRIKTAFNCDERKSYSVLYSIRLFTEICKKKFLFYHTIFNPSSYLFTIKFKLFNIFFF